MIICCCAFSACVQLTCPLVSTSFRDSEDERLSCQFLKELGHSKALSGILLLLMSLGCVFFTYVALTCCSLSGNDFRLWIPRAFALGLSLPKGRTAVQCRSVQESARNDAADKVSLRSLEGLRAVLMIEVVCTFTEAFCAKHASNL